MTHNDFFLSFFLSGLLQQLYFFFVDYALLVRPQDWFASQKSTRWHKGAVPFDLEGADCETGTIYGQQGHN